MRYYSNLREFYKGDDWAYCKEQVLNHRLKNGEVRCEHCGELITKSFNPNKKNNAGAMVFHHVIPLTKLNVNDASISINPANIQIVHWQCHNIIHGRFNGQGQRADQKVYVITGSPCSGKTTFVRERMSAGDVILDIDDIWQQVSGQARYVKPNSLKPIVFSVFNTIEEQIKMRAGTWYQAFIVKSLPLKMDRERYAQQVNADEVIIMDTSKEECLDRLHANPQGRSLSEYETYINQYYNRFIQ